jgi:hypothetical protein
MNKKDLNSLKFELLKIEVNCLKLLSKQLTESDYTKVIENIAIRSNVLKKEVELIIEKYED